MYSTRQDVKLCRNFEGKSLSQHHDEVDVRRIHVKGKHLYGPKSERFIRCYVRRRLPFYERDFVQTMYLGTSNILIHLFIGNAIQMVNTKWLENSKEMTPENICL